MTGSELIITAHDTVIMMMKTQSLYFKKIICLIKWREQWTLQITLVTKIDYFVGASTRLLNSLLTYGQV